MLLVGNDFFLNCCFAAPWTTLDHSQGNSLTNPMLITAFFGLLCRPEIHREPRIGSGALSPAERLVEFELGTSRL